MVQQQSARDFIAVAMGTIQQKMLNMVDDAEAQIVHLRQQVETLKKENEELKVKLQSPKE